MRVVSGQTARATAIPREGLPRPAEVGQVRLPNRTTCGSSLLLQAPAQSRCCWAHFCPHPLGPPLAGLLRITVSIPLRPLFEHQTHLAFHWWSPGLEWPKLIRLDLNTPVFLLKSAPGSASSIQNRLRFSTCLHFQLPGSSHQPAAQPLSGLGLPAWTLPFDPSSSCSQHLLQRPLRVPLPTCSRSTQGTPVAPTVSSVSRFPGGPL